jgi:hypothetical protein
LRQGVGPSGSVQLYPRIALGSKRFPESSNAGGKARVLDIGTSVGRSRRRSKVRARGEVYSGDCGEFKIVYSRYPYHRTTLAIGHGGKDGETDDTIDRIAGPSQRRSCGQGPARCRVGHRKRLCLRLVRDGAVEGQHRSSAQRPFRMQPMQGAQQSRHLRRRRALRPAAQMKGRGCRSAKS